jgi:hypothetical protein
MFKKQSHCFDHIAKPNPRSVEDHKGDPDRLLGEILFSAAFISSSRVAIAGNYSAAPRLSNSRKAVRTDRYLFAGVKPPRETPPEVQQFGGVESPAETSHPAKRHDSDHGGVVPSGGGNAVTAERKRRDRPSPRRAFSWT